MQTLETLLQELDATPYTQRIQRMIELGRLSKEQPHLAELISQLWRGGSYERRLALYSCYGSKDGAKVLASVSDPSRLVRSLSFVMIAPTCNDAQALEALEVAYSRRRHLPVMQMLRKKRRYVPVDIFLERLLAKKDPRFAEYSVFASPEKFTQWMDLAAAQPSQLFWQRGLLRYPLQVARYLLQQIEASTDGLHTKTKNILSSSLATLAQKVPAEALLILEALIVAGAPEWKTQAQELLKKLPSETFAVLQKHKINFKLFSFQEVALRLKKEQFLFLLKEHRSLLGNPLYWFPLLADELRQKKLTEWVQANPEVMQVWRDGLPKEPLWGTWFFQFLPNDPKTLEERVRSYELWSLAARDAKGIISTSQLYQIPSDLREREARRHLTEVRAFDTTPLARLQYCEYLPWQEAQEHLRPWFNHPEVATRAYVLPLFIRLSGAQRDLEVEDILSMFKQRKFESDPVRSAMLGALQAWPRTTWKKEHAASLAQIIQDALTASDLSPGSTNYLEAIADVFLWIAPQISIEWLLQILKVRGSLQNLSIAHKKTREEKRAIAEPCMRLAQLFVPEKEAMLCSLVNGFGDDLDLLPGLQELLAKIDYPKLYLGLQAPLLRILNQHFSTLFSIKLSEVKRGVKPEQWSALLLQLLHYSKAEEIRGDLLEELAAHIQAQTTKQALYQFLLPLYQKQPEHSRPLLFELAKTLPLAEWEEVFSYFLSKTNAAESAEIASLCEDLLQKTTQAITADLLAGILLEKHKQRFEALLPALLAKDLSYGTLPNIAGHLGWSKQTLLTPFLSGKSIQGAFAKKPGWLYPNTNYYRWTATQQQLFSETLDQHISEPKKSVSEVISLLEKRMALGYAKAETAIALLQDERPPIKEKAIRLLSRLDAGQGVTALLECLGDERARFAVYGFRKAVLELPPSIAVELLKKTPMNKVTVAKELFRLLGEMRIEEAYQLLISLYSPALHRDVRIAHLRALWEHLERAETWEVFTRASQDEDWLVAAKLAETPTERLTEFSEQQLARIFAALLSRPEPEARIGILRRATHALLEDKERLLLKKCVSLLGSPYTDECSCAASAVFYRAQGRDLELIVSGINPIITQRRQLSLVVYQLLLCLKKASREQLQIAYGVLSRLLQEDQLAVLSVRLASATNSPQLLLDVAKQLSSRGLLHPDTVQEIYQGIREMSLVGAEMLELALTADEDPLLRRLALAALVQSASSGWTKSRIRRLVAFRQDLSPLVAGTAQFIFPSEE
jgi:cellulose synthase operon protein C